MNRPIRLGRSHTAEGETRFVGPYLVQKVIGRGGTAILYKAKRTSAAGFEKQVVIKTILPELAGDARFVELFTEEAKLSAQLFHANIAQVHDFGVIRGTPFLELELLSGWNLKQLWDHLAEQQTRVPVPIALLAMTEACRGLAYAHAFVDENGTLRPIIHRDISPANVMICVDGAVKLIDFGLASVTRGETLDIETFQGKLAYMSPEQLKDQKLDRRADVFAFGVVMWELLTGRRLFAGDNDQETLQRVAALEAPAPSVHNKRIPKALDRVVLRALARNPAERYQSAGELLSALEGLKLRPATRSELLTYLGEVAPEVYVAACDSCGGPMPHGGECRACATLVEEMRPIPTEPPPVPRHLFVVRTPAKGVEIYPPATVTARALRERALAEACAKVADRIITVSDACTNGLHAVLKLTRR